MKSETQRVQGMLTLQRVMADVALHRLGLLDDASLDITFAKELDTDRAMVEEIVDKAFKYIEWKEPLDMRQRRGARFWSLFMGAEDDDEDDAENESSNSP